MLARSAVVLATLAPPALVLARSASVVARYPRAVPDGARAPFVVALAVSLTLTVVALTLELVAARRGRARGSAGAALGRAFALGVATWLVVVGSQPGDYEPWRVDLGVAVALGSHALLLLLEPWLARSLSPRLRRGLLLAGVELAAVLVLLEVGLRVAADVTGLQLLQTARFEAERVVREAHLPPYGRYMGATLNGAGHLDEEFGPRVPGRARVLVIGDSFSSGPVPYTHHYTAVAERELGDVEVLNVGVPRVGPDEYLVLYRDEGAALDPDLVVIAFFVGNDVHDAHLRRARNSLARRCFDRRLSLLLQVPGRLRRLGAQNLPSVHAAGSVFEPLSIAEAERSMPFLLDPTYEVPSFSESAYRKIAWGRAGYLERAERSEFEDAFAPLLELRAMAEPRPMAILVLPDEYQVEDDVWERACEDLGHVPADRDRPQRELARLCEAAGVPWLDTLPALRAVEPMSDGRRHLYHLRDTHLNARGNMVVGRQLARFVREHLPRSADGR